MGCFWLPKIVFGLVLGTLLATLLVIGVGCPKPDATSSFFGCITVPDAGGHTFDKLFAVDRLFGHFLDEAVPLL